MPEGEEKKVRKPPRRPPPDADGAYLGSGYGATKTDWTSPFPDPVEHHRLVAFRRLTLALGNEFELDKRIQLAIREIRYILAAERATVFIYERSTKTLWTRVHDGQQVHDFEVGLGSGIVGRVAKDVRTLNIKDARSYEGHDDSFDSLTGCQTRAVLAVPMTDGNRELLGVIQVLNKRGADYFDVDDEKLLSTLAQILAINVEHSVLYARANEHLAALAQTRARLEEKVKELELLYSASREVAQALGPRDLVQRIGRILLDSLPYGAAAIVFAREGASCAWPCAVDGRHHEVEGNGGEIALPPWLSGTDEELTKGLSDIGHNLLSREDAPAVVLRFPRNHYVRGALALYGARHAGPVSQDHRKVLAVVLSQLVSGLRRAFEVQSARHEDRLLTIGRTLSGVLHDLRTPMAVINGYSGLLKRELGPEDRERYADGIKAQLGRIEAMTRDVLAFAKGAVTILPEKVYLRSFMSSLEEALGTAYEGEPVRFVFDVADRGTARFDELKMQRVLLNLCRNAVEAMPKGGTCTVRVARQGEEILFEVADEGVGIPEHMRERIFDAFATHGKEGGTGLGLALVRRLVEAHHGRVEVQSAPGEGTLIRIVIPAEYDGRREPPPAPRQTGDGDTQAGAVTAEAPDAADEAEAALQ